jgi:hypothetical protein
VLLAYDVGLAVDLGALERQMAGQRQTLRMRGRAVEYFEYRPAPLRITVDVAPLAIGPRHTASHADVTVYDFGAMAITYAIPLGGGLGDAVTLSETLGDTAVFQVPARALVDDLVARWGSAVREARVSPIVETYLLFHLEALDPVLPPAALWTTQGADIARLLRSEPDPLSEQEVQDALSARLAYGAHDVTLVDWNAAVVYAPDIEDIRTVIDYANVQLLEMRFLDHELDLALDHSYALVSRRPSWFAGLRAHQGSLRRVARMQVDAAVLFEQVSSGLKIFGEQYLARGYRQLADRFRLAEWDATILRKLQTLNSIYGKLSDDAGARRMELLEWIIVLLIAVSIMLPFLGLPFLK